MLSRWMKDKRATVPGGKTAELRLVEQPCPSCTSLVDGFTGAAFHLAERTNLVVIGKDEPRAAPKLRRRTRVAQNSS